MCCRATCAVGGRDFLLLFFGVLKRLLIRSPSNPQPRASVWAVAVVWRRNTSQEIHAPTEISGFDESVLPAKRILYSLVSVSVGCQNPSSRGFISVLYRSWFPTSLSEVTCLDGSVLSHYFMYRYGIESICAHTIQDAIVALRNGCRSQTPIFGTFENRPLTRDGHKKLSLCHTGCHRCPADWPS